MIDNTKKNNESLIRIRYNNDICELVIDENSFVSNDAKKIFTNILLNSYDLIPNLSYNKEQRNNVIDFTYQLVTKDLTNDDLANIVTIFELMVEKANNISALIINGVKCESTNPNFFTKYKMLIEGIKTTYEKGLILVKLLFKESGDNSLLSKYYRLIQGKESFDKRKELFYDLLVIGSEPLFVTTNQYSRKRSYKY